MTKFTCFEGKTRSREEAFIAEMVLLGADGVEDALLDSLVKSATQAPPTRSQPRERKRSRNSERKSCKSLSVLYSLLEHNLKNEYCF